MEVSPIQTVIEWGIICGACFVPALIVGLLLLLLKRQRDTKRAVEQRETNQ